MTSEEPQRQGRARVTRISDRAHLALRNLLIEHGITSRELLDALFLDEPEAVEAAALRLRRTA